MEMTKPILHLGFSSRTAVTTGILQIFLPPSMSCLQPGGLQRDVVYLDWPIAPSYMSPNAGGAGSCGVSANLYTGAQIKIGDVQYSLYLTYGYNLRRLKKKILSQKNTEIHPAQAIFKFN